jgi:uncharacterized protein involved in outer membrane biogenesis
MNNRRWIALVLVLVLVGGVVTLYALPGIARRLAVARIQAITGRPAQIDRIDLAVLKGRAIVHGVRIAERDRTTPFIEFPRIDLKVSLPSLLFGHVWIRELTLTDSTVRIVRLPSGDLNVSDLLGRSESTQKRLDITVDRFRVEGGTVTLQDQAVPGAPVWKSERMTIDARNVSTRRDDGTAVATSVTAGAPVRIEVSKLRLYPIHMAATATVNGLDLALAQVYFPANARFRIDRGRLHTSVAITLDAQAGVRADATGRIDDVVILDAGGEILARVPTLSSQISGFGLRDASFEVARLVANGTVSVRDPTARTRASFKESTVRANVAQLTWPATTPGLVDVQATIPGGGALTLAGTVRPPPAATQLTLRIASLNLAPWAQFLPLNAMVTGLGSADLRIDEPFGTGIPAHVQGTAAITRLGVADGRQRLLGAERVELSGIELQWPERVLIRRVVVSTPRVIVERDAAGNFALQTLVRTDGSAKEATTPAIKVAIGETVVRGGAVSWRDATVAPSARLEVAAIDADVTGAGWPVADPLHVRVGLRPPGGGHVQVMGQVGIDPLSADVRVITKSAELAPYQPYLPTAARVSGAANVDLAVVVPSLADRHASARGTAAVARLDIRDGERTILRAERATASELDIAWPERIAMGRLALARPWLLLERDDKGALALRALAPRADGDKSVEASSDELDVTVARLTIDDGGLRVVDRAISPAFALDVHSGTVRMEGVSTVAAAPAKLDLSARVGGTAAVSLRGTIGPLGGPLKLDVIGELREFAVPRANSYLVNQAGWKSREGRMTAKLRARIDGDALSAKSDIRVSRLQLVRASAEDAAQHRIGLPLGTLTALMKDRRGDISVSVPVGGRLSDPRFDLREMIWSAVRRVAVNAITLPVSWIGRVHFTADSKIQRIEVDPLPFEPGTAELTPEGRTRVTRITAFLEKVPDIRLALTPVVSSRDVAAIKRLDTTPTLEPAALPRDVMVENASRASAVPELGKRRLETVRAAFKQAGIDSSRFTETTVAERTTAETQVEVEVMEPESERPSKVRQTLHRLGVPLKDRADD